MKSSKLSLIITSLLLVCVMLVNFSGCATEVQAADLMEGITAKTVTGKPADDAFTDHQMELALRLFKSSVTESREQNVLVSPLSIQLALAMTANGAKGETLAEMEALLGGELTIEELNEYLYSYVNSLPSGEKYKLQIANSIWFRDDEDRLTVEKDFLQTNADYYGADAYKAPFDGQTMEDINNWVDEHTDGMIDKVLDEINPAAVMYLINALVFDAEWQDTYEKSDIYDGRFTNISGRKKTVSMMHSEESLYLDDGKATGFIKSYKDGKYSFAALLPNEGVDLYDYIAGLNGAALKSTLENAENDAVFATMPKFSYEYELRLNDALAALGMPTAFDAGKADFSRLGRSSWGNIYIGEVLHKTFISVDELGTKAGAVTKVEMRDEAAIIYGKTVTLDRPFVYMIIDNSTDLPIFIGTVTDVK